ncbi:MAG: SDR family NAD(P)-dependent oxidoreductase, partial [Candidatus Cloacimonadaceae bacterium]|nr:SDR family NAD(P)-dependent oxidoreductase [Candidatus Cloacimonadaceae bacterium]
MKAKTLQYIREYKWSNILAMIRNNLKDPKICPDGFQDRLVVISGATSGIGYACAQKYASRGANLLCINRNPEKSEKLRAGIEGKYGVKCDILIADLSRMDDVFRVSRELARMSVPIDVLIHNAGVYLTKRELTSDGFEYVFALHYLAPYIMTYLSMDKLMAQDKARIIMV